jgi:hypothetical protein
LLPKIGDFDNVGILVLQQNILRLKKEYSEKRKEKRKEKEKTFRSRWAIPFECK